MADSQQAIDSSAARPSGELVKGLGLFDSTMIVVGSMIGSGIFIVSADIAHQVQSPGLLLVVWLASGLITLIGALSFGELAAAMPHAGGQYVYLRESCGQVFGFLYGWSMLLVIQTATIAAVAIASSEPTVNALVALLGSSGMCRIAPHHNFVSFHGFNQREIHP